LFSIKALHASSETGEAFHKLMHGALCGQHSSETIRNRPAKGENTTDLSKVHTVKLQLGATPRKHATRLELVPWE
jgi:hypothetical protein